MSKSIEPLRIYDLDEASVFLKVTPRSLRRYVRSNKLEAKRVGRSYLVTGENILRFLGTPTITTQEMQPEKNEK